MKRKILGKQEFEKLCAEIEHICRDFEFRKDCDFWERIAILRTITIVTITHKSEYLYAGNQLEKLFAIADEIAREM